MKKIGIGLLGFGTVGTGVARIIEKNSALIEQRTGLRIQVQKVLVKDLDRERDLLSKEFFTTRIEDVVKDPKVDIVVELMGGVSPAKDYILRAFSEGKHVVSANKELIASDFEELMTTAGRYRRAFLFEAAVGGAVPVLRTIRDSMSSDKIEEIRGIVNGTTNYILSKMTEEGADFGEVLEEARCSGYLEADPRADIDGHDAARKIAILATVAFGSLVGSHQVYTEGIADITQRDIEIAEKLGKKIKLIACARDREGIRVSVYPCMVDKGSFFAKTEGSFNAISLFSDTFGETILYGKGAGKLPTASAVMADIIEIGGLKGRPDFLQNRYEELSEREVLCFDKIGTRALVYWERSDEKADICVIKEVLREEGTQLLADIEDDRRRILLVEACEGDRKKAVARLQKEGLVKEVLKTIRMEEERGS
ncbi:MAG: homoserine dehydrogenase [Filifactor alocis]|nr:homoserine dehydrogenase [Filifactor alocis]